MTAADRDDAAAAWIVRLSADEIDETDWASFRGWLDGDPQARDAYDRALAVWCLPRARSRRRPGAMSWPAGIAAALAIVAPLAGFGVALGMHSEASLATRAGEVRSFDLSDGSRVTLQPDSEVQVTLGLTDRTAIMGKGEALFQVSHRPLRAFRVVAGDDALRVVGTVFGVRRRDGRLHVAVRSGRVAVGPAQGDKGPRVELVAGSVLDHREGTSTFQVTHPKEDG